ncbi:SDR family NAD(P)-dependent oxidoreductase [Kutzneria sp. CA-103260]|uniref:SDR family NAD(P)-dependent oxidoreductase n=1 Tax=Kutzneria sp. CA-103260 TaxID=2802641 RepID=UPI001BA9C400|nr:SDR family oxidoreductase [Kutzneria sp. CA-103260]QUQ62542.1 oxidoreductase [Kutzneria sp. CA-103260]
MSEMQKVALVTGGSRGVGAATVRRLTEDGYRVTFSYLNAEQRAKALADVTGAVPFRADAGDTEAMARLVGDVVTELGQLDVLVHNAAVFVQGRLADPARDEAAMADQFRANLFGVVAATRAAAAHLPDNGRIVLVSSTAAASSFGGPIGDYSATKAALEAYGRAWAHEFGPRGITVNSVQLGPIDTEMLDREAAGEALLSRLPLRRFGRPEEIADVIAYLAGPGASYVTGATLRADGGLSA